MVNIITLLLPTRSQPQRAKASAYQRAKSFLYKSWPHVAEFIAKNSEQAYTPDPHLPPSQKVSQVEIEAGDSEGRLPQLFVSLCFVLRAWYFEVVFPEPRTRHKEP